MSTSGTAIMMGLKHFLLGYGPDEPLGNKPFLLGLRSSRWFIIATVILGIYVDIFLYASTVVTIPFLVEDQLGVGEDEVLQLTGWSMFAYSIASFSVSPLAGLLADTSKSRRAPLLSGLAFLLAGIICLWKASRTSVLLFGRVLQGASAGFVWTIGLALIIDTVGQDEIGGVLAYADIALCMGLASGPPVSGAVLKAYGKDAIYVLTLGLTLVDVLMRLFLVEAGTALRWKPEPAPEAVAPEAVAPDLSNKVTVLSEEGPEDRTSTIGAYIKVVFRSWRILGALMGTWVVSHILITMDVAVPIYLEETFESDCSKVGLMLLVFYCPSLLCIWSGQLADRYGGKWLAIAGLLGCIPSFLGLAVVEKFETLAVPSLMWILMLCAGVSLAVANTPIMAEIIYSLVNKQTKYQWLRQYSGGYGMAYGAFMTIFSLGSLTASLATPAILRKHGWAALMYSLIACCIFGTIPMALWAGPKQPMGRCGMRKQRPIVTEGTREGGDVEADAAENPV
ncbi:hypothetical protein FZEAL_9495 [Fusarium zealandicum]|uniref:Major facilitator superfamily (MFS) profile domain-containing protein n=1 Tax=Fusarium zealandicum TaxID=1053134 RepID=A0A8H4UAK1_9HYPO|nr:hypothetical protein FZEAL_9495 [Fusarium zealandicum]